MKFYREIHENIKRHVQAVIPSKEEPLLKRIAIWSALGIMGAAVAGFFVFALAVVIFSIGLPDVHNLEELAGIESTIIYDRDGGTLYTIHGEENRKYVPLSEISPLLQQATIAIEDDRFYSHGGFDIPAIGKAVLYEVFGIGKPRGGSTITQQLVKNAFLSTKHEYSRKLRELILSVRLEQSYDKDKILELYLNRIPYGNNAYGAETASKIYFAKNARNLTLAESVIVASLPKAPTYYSPFGPNVHSKLERTFSSEELKIKIPKTAADLQNTDYTPGLVGKTVALSPTLNIYLPGRADLVLNRMNALGLITEEEKTSAEIDLSRMNFQRKETIQSAAHFVFYIRALLEDQFGKDVVAAGGLKVYTTLNPELQEFAEKTIAEQIKKSKELHGVSSAALFSVEAKTGAILSMVGSADYFDTEAHGNVNHVFAKLQPGSSFKPIVYAKAFLNRLAPGTVLYDTPTNFGSNYKPQNFEGGFRGPMPIRLALGQSRNIPALKTYFLAGEEAEIVDLANKMGIASLKKDGNYGPPLAIGTGEATLAEMVQAFSVFANNGIKHDYYSVMKVLDRNNNVIYERKEPENAEQEVLDPQVAYLINNVLSDHSVYLGQYLNVEGHTTAAKTGTSNKEITPVKILPANLWTIGYTPSIVTGIWAGNSNGDPTKLNADGYNIAAPIWSKFMTEALKDKENEAFPIPKGIRWVNVSKATGKLPSTDTPPGGTVSEVFASFSVPTEIDDIYKQVEVNEKDNLLPNEFTPKEYIKKKVFMNHHDPITGFWRWQEGIKSWVKNHRTTDPSFPDFPPTEQTKMFTAENSKKAPTIQIVSPVASSIISQYKMTVNVAFSAPNGVSKIVYFLDDRKIPSSTKRKAPFSGLIKFSSTTVPGPHTITVKIYDKIGYVGEAKTEIKFEKPANEVPPPEEPLPPADEPVPPPEASGN